MFYSTSHIQSGYASMILLSTLTMWVLDSFGLYVQYIYPPFTWHFESGLSHSHAQANPDYRILVQRWIISGFRCEIAQSRSQAPERARKVGGKGDAYGASFPNSLKSCAGAAIIATYPNKE